MKRYLLDTNIISNLIDLPDGRVAQVIEAMSPDSVCTSVVVACELRFGAAKRGSVRLRNGVRAALEKIDVVPLGPPADDRYALVREFLERAGTPISANDMLIAAHALALDCTLVTDNEREFRRVPGLRVENWLH